ncbi:dienelactone hydrolase family protein [Gracilimonas tropica]|uniref:dienelactone hydrolase family protein n=1 Tax=Gracilimonas tropica TaxID=454600 RepID=UPI000379B0D7|nr:dienelactone hydrolase family protein [Gracilimonas tropica]
MNHQLIDIPIEQNTLQGELSHSTDSAGLIIFSHGSGSSRLSPRNKFVAQYLNEQGFSTLLFDLLTPDEDQRKERRFDIELLSSRLISVTKWLRKDPEFQLLNFGFFGASTGSASAIQAASILGDDLIQAVVSRGGRPDLARKFLKQLKSPLLLLVGEYDDVVLELNEIAYNMISSPKKLKVIPGATHLFEEAGTLERVAEEASNWFRKYLYWPTVSIQKDFIDER